MSATCRCNMCGAKDSRRAVRNTYWRNGIRHDEGGVYTSKQKIMERRIRRAREKVSFIREVRV